MVAQSYEAEADNEYVIKGNAAIMKCEVPSFVSDFVVVEMWTDSQGGTYYPNSNNDGNICQFLANYTILSSVPKPFYYRLFYLLPTNPHTQLFIFFLFSCASVL